MATERVEKVTLGDLRAAAKASDGIRTGGWEAGDSSVPLAEPLQKMADDILKWFDPEQGWKLTEVRTGFINAQRIEESTHIPPRLRIVPDSDVRIKAKVEEPDKFTPVFHLEAEKPPLRAKGLLRRREVFDFPRVFAPDFTGLVHFYGEGSADVGVEQIGEVFTLDQALKELSSPYYLVGAMVSAANRKYVPSTVIEIEQQKEAGIKYEPARGLNVMVFTRDLIDRTRISINSLRRIQRQLNKKFPPINP